MAMNPSLLPTIDESFYTNLVSKNNNNTQIVVRIPEELNDAYVQGDQYVQRLMNDGTLPQTFKQRTIKHNTTVAFMMSRVSFLDYSKCTFLIFHLFVFPYTVAIRSVLQILDVCRVVTIVCRELKRVWIENLCLMLRCLNVRGNVPSIMRR